MLPVMLKVNIFMLKLLKYVSPFTIFKTCIEMEMWNRGKKDTNREGAAKKQALILHTKVYLNIHGYFHFIQYQCVLRVNF